MLVHTFTYAIKNKVHINTNIDTCMLVRDIHKLMQSRTKFTLTQTLTPVRMYTRKLTQSRKKLTLTQTMTHVHT